MPLDKWDKRFLEVAKLASTWSKDPKAKVGAVIVDSNRQIAAVGYNGFPIRVEDSVERLKDKHLKNQMIIHAEENVILASGTRAKGGTIYVFGKPVCPRCAGAIIQSGLMKVVAGAPKEGTDSLWDQIGATSLTMFSEASVVFLSTSN